MTAFTRWTIRYAGWIVAIGAALSIWTGYYTARLYMNMRPDMEELLPQTARSVVDLNEVVARLESTENLIFLIFSKDPKNSKRFVDDLAGKLKKLPPSVSAGIEYNIAPELEFFGSRKSLYMEQPDLINIRNYIRDRIDYEKSLYNPLNIFSGKEIPEPQLDFLALKDKYENKISVFAKFKDGYYASNDGTLRILLMYRPSKDASVESGISIMNNMRKAADEAIASLNPKSYAPDLEIKFTGGVQNLLEEHASIMGDLLLTTVIVIILTSIAMMAYFKNFWAVFALLSGLFMGVTWTFGAAFFAIGYLNSSSAFLGAIVIGNGINFPIILLARYMEERRHGHDHARGLYNAISSTVTATLTAALAAGLAYGSLMLTSFRGFSQFGIIGFIGMVLCWIAGYTVFPALLTLLDRFGLLKKPKPLAKVRPFSDLVVYVVGHWPRVIWAVSFAITVVSVGLMLMNDKTVMETNLANLRDRRSMESGSGYLGKYVEEVFERDLSPVVIMARKRSDAVQVAKLLRKEKETKGAKSGIAGIRALDDFFPENQFEKIQLLREIKRLLPDHIVAQLGPTERKLVSELLNPNSFRPITMYELPPLIKTKFTEKSGAIGNLVLIEPHLESESWSPDQLGEFITDVRRIADSVDPGTPVAGQLPVTSDVMTAVLRDGPRATLFAFIAVCLLAIFLFRHPGTIGLVLFALILGVSWLGGIIIGFDIKINLLNFIALPITFGIGMDYGVNIFQRYKLGKKRTILNTLRETGGAVGLASVTTIIGYGSLIVASNQAIRSFGIVAVLGEITCVIAALISLPAYIRTRNLRRVQRL